MVYFKQQQPEIWWLIRFCVTVGHSLISSTPANYTWRGCRALCQYYPGKPILSARLISWSSRVVSAVIMHTLNVGLLQTDIYTFALFLYYLMLIYGKSFYRFLKMFTFFPDGVNMVFDWKAFHFLWLGSTYNCILYMMLLGWKPKPLKALKSISFLLWCPT